MKNKASLKSLSQLSVFAQINYVEILIFELLKQ